MIESKYNCFLSFLLYIFIQNSRKKEYKMSKINKKYTLNIKGMLYVEDDIVSVEIEDTGELMSIASFLGDFDAKECTLTVAYAEEYGQE